MNPCEPDMKQDEPYMKQSTAPQTTRESVLREAIAATVQQREASYGDPYHNLTLAAALCALYTQAAGNKHCAAHNAAIDLLLLKVARIATGAPGHRDNYVDGAAYFAIAAECAARDAAAQPMRPAAQPMRPAAQPMRPAAQPMRPAAPGSYSELRVGTRVALRGCAGGYQITAVHSGGFLVLGGSRYTGYEFKTVTVADIARVLQ